jgi:hypothetical protein
MAKSIRLSGWLLATSEGRGEFEQAHVSSTRKVSGYDRGCAL